MPQQRRKTVLKNLLTVMRNRIDKIEKNDKEFKVVGRCGGAVDCVFGCCPKGCGFDTKLRRLIFAQKIGLNFDNSISDQFFGQKSSDEYGCRTRDIWSISQTRNLLRH